MTVTTLSGAQPHAVASSSGYPSTITKVARFNQAANPTAADTVELFWLPKGAQVVGAWLNAAALETGTAALIAELGFEANTAGDAAAPAAIFTATDGAFVSATALRLGPEKVADAAYAHVFNDRTKVVLTWTHAAGTFAAGEVDVVVQYITPGAAVSG